MTQNELAQTGKDGYYHAPTDQWYINGTGPLFPPEPVPESKPVPASKPTLTPVPVAAKPEAANDDKKTTAGKK